MNLNDANLSLKTGRYQRAVSLYNQALELESFDGNAVEYMERLVSAGNPHEQVAAMQVLAALSKQMGKDPGISANPEDHQQLYVSIADQAHNLRVSFASVVSGMIKDAKLTLPRSMRMPAGSPRVPPIDIMLVSLYAPQYPSIYDPVGIEALAGEITKTFGYQDRARAHLFDMQLPGNESDDAVIAEIKKSKPKVVGLSLRLGSSETAKAILARIYSSELGKEEKPLVLLGNSIATYGYESLLKDYPDAICVIGEGEITIKRIIELLEQGVCSEETLAGVPNIAFIERQGKVRTTSRENPDLSLVAVGDRTQSAPLLTAKKAYALLESSRGCPFQCTFCERDMFRLRHARRSFPIERVVNEFEDLAMLGATDFGFVDEDFVDRGLSQVEELTEAIIARRTANPHFRPRFYISTRVDAVMNASDNPDRKTRRDRLWKRLKEAGLCRVFLGVESGSPGQLQRFNKKIELVETKKALAFLKELGIDCEPGFIMFDPLMTIDELKENIDFIKSYGLLETGALLTHDLRATVGTAYIRMLAANKLLGSRFDLDMVSYDYSYSDGRIKLIIDNFKPWEKKGYSLAGMIQGMLRADSIDRDQRTENSKMLERVLLELRNLELDLISLLINKVESEEMPDCDHIIADFTRKRLEIVRGLAGMIEKGMIDDTSADGRLKAAILGLSKESAGMG